MTTTTTATTTTTTAATPAVKIESLTPEQEARMPFYRDKWLSNAIAEVPPELYLDESVKKELTDTLHYMYKVSGHTLKTVLFAPSPIMAMFMASAHEVGKVGTPKKKASFKHDQAPKIVGMKAVEDYLNGFSNPKEIIKNAGKFSSQIYWGASDSGFNGYVEFFIKECGLELDMDKVNALNTVSRLTHLLLICDGFAVVAYRPSTLRTNNGTAIADGKPYMIWQDGVGVIA